MLKDKKSYDTFESIGDRETLSPLGRTVFGAVGEYYGLDPDVRSCSRELIEERLLQRITNPKHVAPLKEYLRGLPSDISGANVESHIRELHRRCVDGKLSLALANGQSEEEIQKLIVERGKSETALAVSESSLVDVLCTDDLTSEDQSNVNYIKLWPKQLNDRLDGGALRGHHVLVFARPEQGKTLFAINLCAGFLYQKLSVLYVGNEEPTADIRDRLRGRLLKTSKASIRGNRAESARRLALVELGSLRITEGTTFASVRACLDADKYDVVLLDQVRNMRFKAESRTAELEAAGIAAREIAKDFGVLVVSITQAGDSATNKVYLEMSDVDSSKTGIPASADLMIGLGSDAAMKLNGLMGISLPKNKLSGLHDHFTVTCNFSTGEVI
jgi:archaellum biogenesis ATPase FlaH